MSRDKKSKKRPSLYESVLLPLNNTELIQLYNIELEGLTKKKKKEEQKEKLKNKTTSVNENGSLLNGRFTIFGNPAGKGRPRVTRFGTYTPRKTIEYESLIRACYKYFCKDLYFGNKSTAIDIIAYVAPLKSFKKQERLDALKNKFFPTCKPDVDNILKSILDALNECAFEDDRFICDLHIRRLFSENPRVEVEIKEALPLINAE